MAKKPFDLIKGIRNLNNITRATNKQTTGISRNITKVVSDNVYVGVDEISKMLADDKSIINNHMSRDRINRNSNKNVKDLYSIINDAEMMTSLSTMMGEKNYKFAQTLKDYEIIKRCIPQIHKVIVNMKNSIISPDAMADSAIGIEYPTNIEENEKDAINDIIEKYKLNQRLDDIVMNYLLASAYYLTVVPYSMIPEMLKDKNLQECIDELNEELGEPMSLLESSGMPIRNSEILTESISGKYYEDEDAVIRGISTSFTINENDYRSALNEALQGIEFIDGGLNHFKHAILNEAIAESRLNNISQDKSMKSILKQLKNKSKTISFNAMTSEGLVDPKTIREIEKNVDFKGCHIEELDPSRVVPFRLRGTLIGYFYVEDKLDPLNRTDNNTNLSSIMDRINASVYLKQNNGDQVNKVEGMIIRSISERLIASVDAKFLNDNYEDMDIIYEFVKINEIHKKNKRVTFFHPNDICEFKRKDGSIMKNCMFMAKLYLLTLLTNILAKVTRGADRQIHYVKTGLSTDVEGAVNSTIRAIKQNQVRYSDIGTINDIFNIVGSMVDVFMPVSVDGERPIDTETISGQNIDMNDDFLNSLLKSIVQSFGYPSSIIDDFENIDFAKTISMSNLEAAKAVLDAQNEINEPLTKLIRLIVGYELPEFEQVNEINAKLAPPAVILHEMNRERLDSILAMAESLSTIVLPQESETYESMKLRKFKENYVRRTLTTLDWDLIDDILGAVSNDAILEKAKNEVNVSEEDNNNSGYDNY